MSTVSLELAASSPKKTDDTKEDMAYKKWLRKVNGHVMSKIARFHDVDDDELNFDIDDLPDQLYHDHFNEGYEPKYMARIVYAAYKTNYFINVHSE